MAKSSDDFLLMSAIAAGDRQAMTTLFDRYSGMVCALCIKMLGDRHEAEDLLVDVFDEIWRRADRYDPLRSSPMTYIVTLARSRAIDRLRMRKRRVEYSLDAPAGGNDHKPRQEPTAADNPAADAAQAEQAAKIREALNTLDTTQRTALELSYYSGLSHGEIAEKLGKPLGTIKGYIRLGLIHLRDKLRTKLDSQGGAM
jgi:RNA polymerase sigma-70 factor (ECF subfamily)